MDIGTLEHLRALRKLGAIDKPEKKGPKERIMELQKNLASLGYKPGPIDRVFGPRLKCINVTRA